MNVYAKVVENNAGGLSLYVMDYATDNCLYAHHGYEHCPGDLLADLIAICAGTNIINYWDGNSENPQREWSDLVIDHNNKIVAETRNGRIVRVPKAMGASAIQELYLHGGISLNEISQKYPNNFANLRETGQFHDENWATDNEWWTIIYTTDESVTYQSPEGEMTLSEDHSIVVTW